MSTKKKAASIRPATRQAAPPTVPAPKPTSEAYKRGASMGMDFIQGFDADDAHDAILGFRAAVTSHLENAIAKSSRVADAAQDGLKALNS